MPRTISAADDIATPLAVADGLEALRQRVVQRLRLHRGEWFLDQEAGVSWLGDILRRPIPAGLAAQVIAAEIREVEGVVSVTNVVAELDRTQRRLQFSADVAGDAGTIAVQAEIA